MHVSYSPNQNAGQSCPLKYLAKNISRLVKNAGMQIHVVVWNAGEPG
jgi:hypothetical protein